MVAPVSTELLHYSAEQLKASGVEQVETPAPVYAVGDLLHPLVDEERRPLGEPFVFYKFGLAVAQFDEEAFNLRLVPPAGKKISTPIEWPERPDFHKHLPKVGYTALRAVVEVIREGSGSIALFGEDEQGGIGRELVLPSRGVAKQLVHVISSQVAIKASGAASSKDKIQ